MRQRGRERERKRGFGWMDGSELNSCQHLLSVNVLSRVCQSAFPHSSVPALEVVCVGVGVSVCVKIEDESS